MKVAELRVILQNVDGNIEVTAHSADDPVADLHYVIDGFLLQGIVNGEVLTRFVIGYE